MRGYSAAGDRHMVRLYGSLSEKDRRRYAAVEAEKLGHGGVQYIADLLGCDPHTIHHGAQDIEQLPADEAEGRVRKKGGRKKASVAQPDLLLAKQLERAGADWTCLPLTMHRLHRCIAALFVASHWLIMSCDGIHRPKKFADMQTYMTPAKSSRQTEIGQPSVAR